MVFPDEPTLLDTTSLLNRKLTDLPTSGVQNGAMAFCSDCLKDGEVSGAGTGTLVYFNYADSTWRHFSNDTTAAT